MGKGVDQNYSGKLQGSGNGYSHRNELVIFQNNFGQYSIPTLSEAIGPMGRIHHG